jgi:hypothetical protein
MCTLLRRHVCVCVKLDKRDLQIMPFSKFKFPVDQYSEDHILIKDDCEIVPVIFKFPLHMYLPKIIRGKYNFENQQSI